MRQPIYRFVQSTNGGGEEFRREIKKLQLIKESGGKEVILFEDETGFSLHPKMVRMWVKKGIQPYIQIHYLPAYHPELNYQEIFWRTMRYEETTNVFFETIKDLEDAIFKRSQRWKPKKIKSLYQLI